MKFIQLTDEDKNKRLVNIAEIQTITEQNHCVEIWFRSGGVIYVIESFQEVRNRLSIALAS